jgi:hypothetical protein
LFVVEWHRSGQLQDAAQQIHAFFRSTFVPGEAYVTLSLTQIKIFLKPGVCMQRGVKLRSSDRKKQAAAKEIRVLDVLPNEKCVWRHVLLAFL